jgi:hypothetical protein
MRAALILRKTDTMLPKIQIGIEKTMVEKSLKRNVQQKKKGMRREREAQSTPPLVFGSRGFSKKSFVLI